MDVESGYGAQRVKADGVQACHWNRVKGIPKTAKDKVVEVGSSIRKLGQDDPRRVIHSLKVGLALTLVSLVYYIRPFYDGYGLSGMWAVLTVVVVFEFTVGGTLSRGINRGCATLLAGTLGVGSQHLACLFGKEGEPIVLGILVFFLGAAATFTRFFPRIKARYDYGVLIFILTYSMVAVSGYRVEDLLLLAHQRLSTVLIGGAICIIVSIFVCPVWAGEDLHKLIAGNIDKLADYLEGFGGEYFQCEDDEIKSKSDKTCLQRHKSILTSKNTEETLANLARWEPCHGRFGFRHPWKQYLKIGALARQCAYQIETLNGYVCSDIQAPEAFKNELQAPCMKVSSEISKALKMCASAIKLMTDPSPAIFHVESSKSAVEELKSALNEIPVEDSMDLLEIVPTATVASVLICVAECVEEISEAVLELSHLAHFKEAEKATVSPENKPSQLLHRGVVNPVVDGGNGTDCVVIEVPKLADCSAGTAGGNPRAPKSNPSPPLKS
ncbi:aluminum-activated malate transporter 8 [Punica granatum]|uniref:Uncharacterized protein n=2 Tax=Punica granatum TaxID=22663 RepID=A0A218X3F9_PUNGR|nr:aluminum-activated malate transporter 8 [Punica granatum]OWM79031.1 hypothetical protein CDL15_Pgr003202 [Punica granatum]PKI42974.1 hypothetical protein CRG98_036772 [Punica granatum]